MPYTDSVPVTVILPLRGVWLNDTPPFVLTAVNFVYGKAKRDHSLDTMGVGAYYAGRESPVYDYGEHIDNDFGVSIDIPNGSTYIADIERLEAYASTRRPVWMRDNRGRVAYGVIYNLKVNDEDWGAVASFTVTRTDRDITTVVP